MIAPRPVPLVLAATCFALAVLGTTAAGADSGSGPEPLVEAGRELYLTGCSGCHGVDGRGVRVADAEGGLGDEVVSDASGAGELRGPSLRGAGAAGAYYYLSTGRMPLANPGDQPRRKDPAYDPAEIEAIVAYVGTLGAGPRVPDIDLSGADLAEGGVIFRANCQACHSAFGSGGALSYGRAAPNLHASEPLEVGAAVRVGPGQMPAFGPDLIELEALDDLVAYVDYLRSPPSEGGLQIGRNGPVPEGFVIWLFGVGGLLLVAAWIGGRAPIRLARADDTPEPRIPRAGDEDR